MRLNTWLSKRGLWLAIGAIWLLSLVILSGTSKPGPDLNFEVPHIDKVLHFGYFFGGGIILTTYLLIAKGRDSSSKVRIVLPILILAVIGALDEYHQSFTPGRNGNDPFDWLADVAGATAGTLLSQITFRFLQGSMK